MIEKFSELDLELKEISSKALYFKEKLKIRKIKDIHERKEALVYLIYSKLHLKYLDLSHKLEKNSEKSFSAEMHLKVIPSKLRMFRVEPKKETFYNILSILKKIESELNGVV